MSELTSAQKKAIVWSFFFPWPANLCPICGSEFNSDPQPPQINCKPGNCSVRPRPKNLASDPLPLISDLNAMRDVENKIKELNWTDKYIDALYGIFADDEEPSLEAFFIFASAEQRLQAAFKLVPKDRHNAQNTI